MKILKKNLKKKINTTFVLSCQKLKSAINDVNYTKINLQSNNDEYLNLMTRPTNLRIFLVQLILACFPRYDRVVRPPLLLGQAFFRSYEVKYLGIREAKIA